jgi:hypothetical protein
MTSKEIIDWIVDCCSGKENAMNRDMICSVLNVTLRELRLACNEARKHNILIAYGNDGIYNVVTKDEQDTLADKLHNLAMDYLEQEKQVRAMNIIEGAQVKKPLVILQEQHKKGQSELFSKPLNVSYNYGK